MFASKFRNALVRNRKHLSRIGLGWIEPQLADAHVFTLNTVIEKQAANWPRAVEGPKRLELEQPVTLIDDPEGSVLLADLPNTGLCVATAFIPVGVWMNKSEIVAFGPVSKLTEVIRCPLYSGQQSRRINIAVTVAASVSGKFTVLPPNTVLEPFSAAVNAALDELELIRHQRFCGSE